MSRPASCRKSRGDEECGAAGIDDVGVAEPEGRDAGAEREYVAAAVRSSIGLPLVAETAVEFEGETERLPKAVAPDAAATR